MVNLRIAGLALAPPSSRLPQVSAWYIVRPVSDSDHPTFLEYGWRPDDAPVYPDHLRLPLVFDADRLAADLAKLTGIEWTAHFVRDNYAGNWSALPLRSPAGERHPIRRIAAHSHVTDWVDTEYREMCPYLHEVLASFACEMGAARLMRLTPGSQIKEHSDPDLAAEYGRVRLHIPITTNSAVDFRVNGGRIDMLPGECWYLRLADPHTVRNDGENDRIHLVIDCKVNAWIEALLHKAQIGPKGRDSTPSFA